MSSNTRCLGLSRQHYLARRLFMGSKNIVSRYSGQPAFSRYKDPIEMFGNNALGGILLVETILRQTRTPSSVHSQRNGVNCLNSCWIMLCKVWYDVWNVASHSTVDISRTDTFL
ncbi:hypothetical protein TNCV_2581441 [Trichonephila clavipes]|nr:hypothetical protein TNCV_2581441 [Trichonephila clavipes]